MNKKVVILTEREQEQICEALDLFLCGLFDEYGEPYGKMNKEQKQQAAAMKKAFEKISGYKWAR